MYKVSKNGKTLTVASKLLRCRMQSNGVPVIDKDGAGVIVGGTIYNLPGYGSADIEEPADVRELIGEIQAGSTTTEDVYMALAELGQLIAGGVDHG